MTVATVRLRLKEIRECVDDDERAHSKEDDLLHEVIQAIASGKTDDPQGIALEALQSREIVFSRWCA